MVDRDYLIYIKILEKRGSEFDIDLYKYYIRSGQMVNYIVWLVFFFYENGFFFFRGIVQLMVGK